ncbi:MAG: hypothetical protein LBR74_01250 [Eubacterium sp.]|jgi:uncharacterized protein YcfL|nr:hypothetical protein [Eubacterium sp.]
MKKYLTLFLIALLTLTLAACGSGETVSTLSESSTEPVSNAVSEPTQSSTPSVTNAPTQNTEDIAISEHVILEQDGIKVTLKALESSFMGPELKVLIENESDEGITIQARNASINDVMLQTMFSADVEPGKKANSSISFLSAELERAGIEIIKDVELALHIFNTDSWETVFDSETITFSTTADPSFVQAYNDVGEVLYEENGLRVVLQGVESESSLMGTDVLVYVENLSSSDLTVQTRNVSVNGFMIEPVFSCEVVSGKRAYSAITLLQAFLDENNITNIDEMEFALHIFDTHTMATVAETDAMSVTFD